MRRISKMICQVLALLVYLAPQPVSAGQETVIQLHEVRAEPVTLKGDASENGSYTWWLPSDYDSLVVPMSGGVVIEKSRNDLQQWLRKESPWNISELPILGARYGDQMLVLIVPWPHYAELIVEDRVGIRYSFPDGRRDATPCELVVMRRGTEPLEVAHAFREWRRGSKETGAIPPVRSLTDKAKELPRVSRLFGAPHIYLWGPPGFSKHDVDRKNWIAFAGALQNAKPQTLGRQVVEHFSDSQRTALQELAAAKWPIPYLIIEVAAGIESGLLKLSANNRDNPAAPTFAKEYAEFVHPIETWGDGMSLSMLDALHTAGIQRGVLLSSDLYTKSPRGDVARRADETGFLLGPYDSYHSVHSPRANPNETWDTAQFDLAAYETGRVLNADGTGHAGFRGRGFHFSPAAAWPYVKSRVDQLRSRAPYSTWFVDCDATAECFDDYSPHHSATRRDDITARRSRLKWLESSQGVVVGSEGGSVLFADVMHFGHGPHTPYIGHLDPAFKDRSSPHFLGKYWPSDAPEQSFKPVPVPPAMKTPYFDPTVRIPLYRAAIGDEVIVSHHWSTDSLKFSDIAATRELLEILYLVPPMYHLNRETWPARRAAILKHLEFWGPLHGELAEAPLVRFEWLSSDHLLQRTTFRGRTGDVTLTANFSDKRIDDYPPMSIRLAGDTQYEGKIYEATGK